MKSIDDSTCAFLVEGACFRNDMPVLSGVRNIDAGNGFMPFDIFLSQGETGRIVHFYVYDRYFINDEYGLDIERNAQELVGLLQNATAVVSPDYTVGLDMPLPLQEYAIYRGRAMAYYLQSQGLTVLPNVRWGSEKTFELAVSGLEKCSTIVIGTHGTQKNKETREAFLKGFKYVMKSLCPNHLIIYGVFNDELRSYVPQTTKVSVVSDWITEQHTTSKEVV